MLGYNYSRLLLRSEIIRVNLSTLFPTFRPIKFSPPLQRDFFSAANSARNERIDIVLFLREKRIGIALSRASSSLDHYPLQTSFEIPLHGFLLYVLYLLVPFRKNCSSAGLARVLNGPVSRNPTLQESSPARSIEDGEE